MQLNLARTWGSRLRPTERTAVLLWMLILGVICIRVAISPRAHSVFPIFSTAGLHWRQGQELYAPYFLDPDLDVFRYSPLAAGLFAPWSVLSDRAGGVLWRLANAVFYLGALAWWGKIALPICLGRSQQAFLFLLAMPLAIGCLNNGQSNVFLTALLFVSAAGLHTGRLNLAAGCMALAVFLKVYPMALGLLFTLFFPRKFGTRFFLALLLGLALPFLLQKPSYVAGQYAHWWDLLSTDHRHERPVSPLCSKDLWLLVRLAHIPMTIVGYRVTQLALAGGIGALCLAGRRAGWPQRRLLTLILSLGSCWMVLCGPATESCTYILVAPILAWAAIDAAISGPRPIWSRLIPWCSFALFCFSQIISLFPEDFRLQLLGILPLAGIVLFAGLIETGLRSNVGYGGRSQGRLEHPLADHEPASGVLSTA